MPEGPSIVIAKEALGLLKGQKIVSVAGKTKIDSGRLVGQTVTNIRSWGKHLLICFKGFTLRVHFLMFGKFTINERRTTPLMLSLKTADDTVYFYTSSMKLIEGPLSDTYDWTADVMNPHWSARGAQMKLSQIPKTLICDALLDQEIFSGVGNIIRNEIMFRARIHPLSRAGKLPAARRAALIREARAYSFDFLKWKKKDQLAAHWEVYTKKVCPRDHHAIEKKYLGVTARRVFFCPECQIRYK